MTVDTRSAGLIAARLGSGSGWIAVETLDPRQAVEDLRIEIDTELGPAVEVLRALDLNYLARLDRPVVMMALEDMSDAELGEMDARRGRLVDTPAVVLVGIPEQLSRVALLAPHVWSWIGADVWRLDDTPAQLDVMARLDVLRGLTGLTDADVVARAAAGSLPRDPVFAEWLALMGRGDLFA